MNQLKTGFALGLMLFALSACGRGSTAPLPLAPTPTGGPPLATPGASPAAIPATLGEKISGVVTVSDLTCDPGYVGGDPEPCKRFAIAIPTAGVLKVQASTIGPYSLTLGIGSLRGWESILSAAVHAGSTYEITVALHGGEPGKATQAFELTTSLGPL